MVAFVAILNLKAWNAEQLHEIRIVHEGSLKLAYALADLDWRVNNIHFKRLMDKLIQIAFVIYDDSTVYAVVRINKAESKNYSFHQGHGSNLKQVSRPNELLHFMNTALTFEENEAQLRRQINALTRLRETPRWHEIFLIHEPSQLPNLNNFDSSRYLVPFRRSSESDAYNNFWQYMYNPLPRPTDREDGAKRSEENTRSREDMVSFLWFVLSL